jgi:hypothetical protein
MQPRKYLISTLTLFIVSLFPTISGICQNINDEKVTLVFDIHQEQDIYDKSTYGEPPQFAIWIEDAEHQSVKTVFVTRRTGTGEFDGKVECPISLPVWIGIFRKETGRDDFPLPWDPVIDGLTGATPKIEDFNLSVKVDEGIRWFYYIEINVSGDYNKSFPYISSKKHIDNHGNGQPSLIFKGEINSLMGETSKPELIGRSDQYYFSTKINYDLEGISSAIKVFSEITVKCM